MICVLLSFSVRFAVEEAELSGGRKKPEDRGQKAEKPECGGKNYKSQTIKQQINLNNQKNKNQTEIKGERDNGEIKEFSRLKFTRNYKLKNIMKNSSCLSVRTSWKESICKVLFD